MLAKLTINNTVRYFNLDKLVSATFTPAHHRKADPPDFPEARDMPATLELVFDCPDRLKGYTGPNDSECQDVFLYTVVLKDAAALELRNILDYGAITNRQQQ